MSSKKPHEILRQTHADLTACMDIDDVELSNYLILNVRQALTVYEEKIWRDKNPNAPYVPMKRGSIMDYPVGPDGHIILEVPELLKGIWYEPKDDEDYASSVIPFGPVGFHMDVPIDIFHRYKGEIEKIIPSDVEDWNEILRYRVYETLEDLDDLGMF